MRKSVLSVLVTGTNRGLGGCLAERFAREGWLVFAGQRNLAQSSAPVRDVSHRMTLLGLDVRDGASVIRAAKLVRERTRGLDVLIDNAAINPCPEYEAPLSTSSWRDRSYGYCMSRAALDMRTTILDRASKGRASAQSPFTQAGCARTWAARTRRSTPPRRHRACTGSSMGTVHKRHASYSTTGDRSLW
jgi:short subunit dehydrogenase